MTEGLFEGTGIDVRKLRQTGVFLALALVALISSSADQLTALGPGDRTISLYHIHTKEHLTITYRRNGRYVPAAMKKIDWIMRDWRQNKSTRIDPKAIDLAWEMHTELGSSKPIHIICGYRSPKTNSMLRRTRGGQAKRSYHMTGQALDITFPDIPIKKLRYSALLRERGGVGYYPTSGIPFVHIDTARVRAWPRLPRYELALLFPKGRTKHRPTDGGRLRASDSKVAQARYKKVAVQIAHFKSERRSLSAPTLIAQNQKNPAAASSAKTEQTPKARKAFAVASAGSGGNAAELLPWLKNSSRSKSGRSSKGLRVLASLGSDALPQPRPRLVERPSRFRRAGTLDRAKLEGLIKTAALNPLPSLKPPKLVERPREVTRPREGLAKAALTELLQQDSAERGDGIGAMSGLGARMAAVGTDFSSVVDGVTDMSPGSQGNGWVSAPAFDDDHPEELAYRTFPLAPLLADTLEAHDAALANLQHPNVAATFDMIDDEGAVPPMNILPGRNIAQAMWAQQFEGKAVNLDALTQIDRQRSARPSSIGNRAVQTSANTY